MDEGQTDEYLKDRWLDEKMDGKTEQMNGHNN